MKKKKILLVLVVAITVLFLVVIIFRSGPPTANRAASSWAWNNTMGFGSPADAVRAVESVVYEKDSRTGLCFAYVWGGGVQGGPALSWVPCAEVPGYLLNAK